MCAHVSSPSTPLTPYYERGTCLKQGQGPLAHYSQRRGANRFERKGKSESKIHLGYSSMTHFLTTENAHVPFKKQHQGDINKAVAKLKKFEKVLMRNIITENYHKLHCRTIIR